VRRFVLGSGVQLAFEDAGPESVFDVNVGSWREKRVDA
jgi:hypothetical protein